MPTEVAQSVAPTNRWAARSMPGSRSGPTTKAPSTKGTDDPDHGHRERPDPDLRQLRDRRSRDRSGRAGSPRPARRKRSVASSATLSKNPMPSRVRFPRTTPITSSPSTPGMPTFSTNELRRARNRMTASHRKVWPAAAVPAATGPRRRRRRRALPRPRREPAAASPQRSCCRIGGSGTGWPFTRFGPGCQPRTMSSTRKPTT